jgi:hypothetical protein
MVQDRLPFFRRGQVVARVGDAGQEPGQLFVGLVILGDPRRARFDELGRRNAEAWMEQSRSLTIWARADVD